MSNCEEQKMLVARKLLHSSLESAAIDLPKGGQRKYRRLLVSANNMRANELSVNEAFAVAPVLVVPGTSVSFQMVEDSLIWFLCHGYPVAFIENPVGGFFDMGIDPKLERPIVLSHFLDYLQRFVPNKIEKVIGLFQSYAAFDVIRLISKDLRRYRSFIPLFFFDNPAGFNGPVSVFAHIWRWQFAHIIGGLAKYALSEFWDDAYPVPRKNPEREEYKRREKQDLWVWWKNTLKNPVRGAIRELLDLCRFRAEKDMKKILEAGYSVGMFKHSGDRILPINKTMKYSKDLFKDKFWILDGGHNDLFVQQRNRQQIVDIINACEQ